MAIHYDAKSKRFRDERGRLVSKDRAMRSSIARKEYEKAQRKARPMVKPKAEPKAPPAKKPKVSHAKPPVKKKPKVSPAKPTPKKPRKKPPVVRGPRVLPWEQEGIVQEYPEPDEWFPEVDFYDYDDLYEDWGEFEDEETDS